jgi:TetR/AcrR family tetracycline transcriptional repressor
VLFTYRIVNSFLLGYLLLETSAMALRDSKPGDGSFSTGPIEPDSDAAESSDPVPAQLSPTRTPVDRIESFSAEPGRHPDSGS